MRQKRGEMILKGTTGASKLYLLTGQAGVGDNSHVNTKQSHQKSTTPVVVEFALYGKVKLHRGNAPYH